VHRSDVVSAAGVPRAHDKHQLHAMALGLVGQTAERTGDIQGAMTSPATTQAPHSSDLWICRRRQP
jgi:hypothetical protein